MQSNKSQKKLTILVGALVLAFEMSIVFVMSAGSGNWIDRIAKNLSSFLTPSTSESGREPVEASEKEKNGSRQDHGVNTPDREGKDAGTRMEGENIQPAENGIPIHQEYFVDS